MSERVVRRIAKPQAAEGSSMNSRSDVIEALSQCKKILVTTHVRPDGDALGTTGALVLALRKKGIDADVLLLSKLPSKYAFIYDDHAIRHFELTPEFSLEGYDAFLCADTGTWSQLPGLKEIVLAYRGKKIVIDHHLTQEDWADVKLVDTSAAAASEVVEVLLRDWGVELDREIASCLFLGIASDTGWFQFSNTRPQTMRVAAELMEAGVDTDRMYQLLYQNERAERLALQARAIASLELLAGGRLAVMMVRKTDFTDVKANVPDTESIINWPLQIRAVEVSILIVEPLEAGPVRISLRSKGSVDVARFAEQFGGGGHARAAGLKIDATLGGAKDRVVTAMLDRLK
jgi:bifunctional oligoribonuclease and PAP phosphatase NrnA